MQRRITKDLLTYLPAKALPALAAFITVPIYTHLFSPGEYGYYALAVAASEFLLLGTTTGFGQGAVRFYSAYQLKSGLSSYFAVLFNSVILITLAAASASAVLVVAFRPLISNDLYPLLWGAIVLYVVSAINATLMDVLRGQENSRWYSIIWISQVYAGIIFGLILVLEFGMDISGLIWGQTIGLLLPIIPLIWLTTHSIGVHPLQANRSDYKQLWAFSMPYTIGNLAFWSLSLADRYIVELFQGSYEVGLYSLATKISSRSILLLVSLFFLVPAPLISRLWEQSGRRAAEDALTGFTRMFFLMVIPAVAGLAMIAAPLVKLLADEAYYGAYPAIWLAALASMGLGLSDLGSSGCMVTNKTRLIARNQCIAAAAGLILNFILVPTLGFMGAALSAALAFSFLAILQAISSARFLTWRWPLQSLWRVLVASAVMFVAVALLQALLRSDTTIWQIVNLLASVTVGGLIYFSLLWILGEIKPKDFQSLLRSRQQRLTTTPIEGDPGRD